MKKLADGTEVVVGNAPNTAAVISAVKTKLMSGSWNDLTNGTDWQ